MIPVTYSPELDSFYGPGLLDLTRHLAIAGGSGAGKSVGVKSLIQRVAYAGVPVIVSDPKGDLTGLAEQSLPDKSLAERLISDGMPLPEQMPISVSLLDHTGRNGKRWSISVDAIGGIVELGRLAGCNDRQLDDLRNIDRYRVEELRSRPMRSVLDVVELVEDVKRKASRRSFTNRYPLSPASVRVIHNKMLSIGDLTGNMFGPDRLDLAELMHPGLVTVISRGDLDDESVPILGAVLQSIGRRVSVGAPKGRLNCLLVNDEAHYNFNKRFKSAAGDTASFIKVCRSAGVGTVWVTQDLGDLPEAVLAQVANRVQFAPNVNTPKQQRALQAHGKGGMWNLDNLSPDPVSVLPNMQQGEALVQFVVDGKKSPARLARFILPTVALDEASPETIVQYAEPMSEPESSSIWESVTVPDGVTFDLEDYYEDVEFSPAPPAPDGVRDGVGDEPSGRNQSSVWESVREFGDNRLVRAVGTSAARSLGTAAARSVVK